MSSSDQSERIVGSYRLIKRIGAGGMGVVYHGQHRRIGRDAAIKILPLHLAEDADFLKRFEREAASVASLQHPHILPVWEYGEHEGSPYLVMPYIRGGTLKERLQEKTLTHEQVSRFLVQIAESLDYAHTQGIIHRDVKPANLLLTERGHLYLADFGIAKVLESAEGGLTRTGVGIGTPEYIAPEQAHGRAEKRSDLYALGIILYQMLTGRVPFSGRSALDTLLQHMNQPLPTEPLQHLPPETAQAVTTVLIKATQKDPEDRYQTGAELAEAFAAAIGQARGAVLPRQDRPTAPGLTPLPPGMTAPGVTPPPGMTPPPRTLAPSTHPSGMTAPPILTPLPPSSQGQQATFTPGQGTQPGLTQPGMTHPGAMTPGALPPRMAQTGPLTPPPLAPQSPLTPPPIPSRPATGPLAPVAPPARRTSPLIFIAGGLVVVLLIAAVGFMALRGDDPPPPTATIAAVVPSAPPITPSVAGATGVTPAAASAPASSSAQPSGAPTPTPTRATGAAVTSGQPQSAAPSPTPTVILNWRPYAFGPDDSDERTPNEYRLFYDEPSDEARIELSNGTGYSYRIGQLTATDFVMEIDIRKHAGPVDSVYGFFFRVQPQQSGQPAAERYRFLFDEQGQHVLFHELGDGTSVEVPSLQPPSTRTPVKGGNETNRLRITARGEEIIVEVNDQIIARYVGTLIKGGQVGITARRGSTPERVLIGFTNLRIASLR